jgi:hypothetical protein
MLAITYWMKKEMKVAKWGTPKKYLKKPNVVHCLKTLKPKFRYGQLLWKVVVQTVDLISLTQYFYLGNACMDFFFK